jgi:hypothetical protein
VTTLAGTPSSPLALVLAGFVMLDFLLTKGTGGTRSSCLHILHLQSFLLGLVLDEGMHCSSKLVIDTPVNSVITEAGF